MHKLIFFTLLVAASSQAAKFPAKWTKCPKVNNDECLKRAVTDAIVSLKDGNKELNMLPLDPLHFERMELNQGKSGPVAINLTLYNLDVIGASRISLTSVKVDWDKYEIIADGNVLDGPLTLHGDYTMDGKILVLPLNGKGKANITMENFSALFTLKGKEKIKNGKKYFFAEKGNFMVRSPKVHLQFSNLLGDHPELGNNINAFLNENSKLIMAEMNNTISNAIGFGIKEISNQFFKKIPVTDLFTE